MRPFSKERLLGLLALVRDRGLFLRHDVDLSLEAAVKMGEFERLLGVKATYYIWPRSEFYNPFSTSGREAIETLRSQGHHIGLHFSASDDLQDLLMLAADWPLDWPQRISFHEPSQDVLWRDFGDFDNAYGSKWEGRYLSDSRGEFRQDPEDWLAKNDPPLQVSLHCEHWISALIDAPRGSATSGDTATDRMGTKMARASR